MFQHWDTGATVWSEATVPTFAMKVYDLQWFTTFDMTYDQAAEALVADGIDTVLTQNRIDPLPHSGVDQRAYLARFADRLAVYDDHAWVEALKRHGLRVLETSAVFFDPAALERLPDARPVDADGQPDRGIDWYVGICPTHEAYVSEKVAKLRRVTAEFQPDGIFLQFIRYPGFWENWTWSPDYVFTNRDRFCFCDRCRSLFADEQGIVLPAGSAASHAVTILADHAQSWASWRCEQVAAVVGRIRTAVNDEAPGTGLMLNTLPFPTADFGGQDVRRTFAAQDLRLLAPQVERFELMTYLQILNRPISWLSEAIEDARGRLPPDREVVCTLQVDALYTTGIHRARNRPTAVTADDLEMAGRAALEAGADGLVFYHWTDVLHDEAEGGRKHHALKAITGA